MKLIPNNKQGKISLVLMILMFAFVGYMAATEDVPPTPEELCRERGGIPLYEEHAFAQKTMTNCQL